MGHRDTAEEVADAVADATRDRRRSMPSFRPQAVSNLLDHWLSKAFGVVLLAAVGGQGSTMLTQPPKDDHAVEHDLEDHIEEYERKVVVLDRGISANTAMRRELDSATVALDQIVVIHLREKAAGLAPRHSLRMQYADRAERLYRRLIEDGMKRDKAIRRVAYQPID